MIDTAFWMAVLVGAILLMDFSSDKAVKHSIFFASASGISPLMIGLILVSLGTDLPEIINSIISSSMGHANINVGDSIGSVLTQLTLVLGLLPFIGKKFKVRRKEVIVMGACLLLSLMLAYSILEKGYVSRINALFLVGSWPTYMAITHFIMRSRAETEVELDHPGDSRLHYVSVAILGLIGVGVAAYAVVQSIIMLSESFKVPEYLLSFFLASIGTSLPELVVDLAAISKGQFEVAIGDLIGSCIIDASVSIGIGLLLFPQAVSGGLASITTLFTIFASIMVILLLALREKVDRKAGVLFLGLYLSSYVMLEVLLLFGP